MFIGENAKLLAEGSAITKSCSLVKNVRSTNNARIYVGHGACQFLTCTLQGRRRQS